MVLRAIASQADIVICTADVLAQTMREVRPTHLLGTPATYNVYAEAAELLMKRWSRWSRALHKLLRAAHVNRLSWSNPLKVMFWLALFKPTRVLGGRAEEFRCSGAPASQRHMQALDEAGVQAFCTYGSSEIGAISADTRATFRPGSCGKPTRTVRISHEGEILVKTHRFDRDISNLRVNTDSFIHTGDCGTIEEEYLYVRGRLDDIIVLATGKKVIPDEVEPRLTLPGIIARAYVLPLNGRQLGLLAVLSKGADASSALRHLRDVTMTLPPHCRATSVKFVNSEALAAVVGRTHKIMRRELPLLFEQLQEDSFALGDRVTESRM